MKKNLYWNFLAEFLLKLTDPWQFPAFYSPLLAGLLSQRCVGNTLWRTTNLGGGLYSCKLKSRSTRECQGILTLIWQDRCGPEVRRHIELVGPCYQRLNIHFMVWKAADGCPSVGAELNGDPVVLHGDAGLECLCKVCASCLLGGVWIIRDAIAPPEWYRSAEEVVSYLELQRMSVVRKTSFTFRHLARRGLFICLGTSASDEVWFGSLYQAYFQK